MQKKYTIPIFAILAVGLLGIAFVTAFPMGFGGFGQDLTEEERTEMQEQRELIKEAVENGDFEEWKVLMEQRLEQMRSRLTEENFQKLMETHQKRLEQREACENEDCEGCGFHGLRPREKGFFGTNSLGE